ncbi:hypothetical protein ACU4HD_47885 [Cupriavidus basilensis]
MAHGHVVAHDGEVVAAKRRVVARAVWLLPAACVARSQRSVPPRFGQHLAEAIDRGIVARLMRRGQHGKALLAIVMIEVIEQLEARARRQHVRAVPSPSNCLSRSSSASIISRATRCAWIVVAPNPGTGRE